MKKKLTSLRDWNKEQVHLSQGEANKIEFHQMYKRHGTPSELLQFYVDAGGADYFARKHRRLYSEMEEADDG